jgi:hypothetical protein
MLGWSFLILLLIINISFIKCAREYRGAKVKFNKLFDQVAMFQSSSRLIPIVKFLTPFSDWPYINKISP